MSQFSPESGKLTLADLNYSFDKQVYPIGRLDYDSEGLLLLTDDKQINNQLLNPVHSHQRIYWVQVEGLATEEKLKPLQQGIEISIDGKKHFCKPAQAVLLSPNMAAALPERNPPIRFRKSVPDSWIALTISEGKNRQVRKMTAAIGFPTLRLVRFSIEGINIEHMQPGDIREFEKQDFIKLLRL